jgi:hypothetical protein
MDLQLTPPNRISMMHCNKTGNSLELAKHLSRFNVS